jgi:diacylglycerol O-acyltransferase / wax synthase
MRYLSGTDTHMLYSDAPHAMNMIAPIGIFDPSTAPGGEVSYDDVLGYVGARLHLSTTFRERLVRVPLGLDRPMWINDEYFDIEYHVREIALPAPGTWEQLTTQVARIGARPLDMTRPPWELYVIQGVDSVSWTPKGSFAMMLKLHHAAVDGVSGAELITALMEPGPDVVVPAAADDWTPEAPPSTLGRLVRGGVQTVARPVLSARTILRAVGGVPSQVKTQLFRPEGTPKLGSSASSRFNTSISPHRVWDFVAFDLADVKAIKNAVPGVTVNDVAVTIVGGAVRRYLEHHGEGRDTSLNAIMPISARPTATQQTTTAHDSKDGKGATGGNRFVMTLIPIGTQIADPVERLHDVKRSTESAKEYGTSASDLVESTELIPGALIGTTQKAVIKIVNRLGQAAGAHLIVTNVPGPRQPMYFAGAKATGYSGMAPVVDGVGLIIGIGGYVDDFSVTFTADRDMMPDPEFFSQCLRAEYAALREATLVGS